MIVGFSIIALLLLTLLIGRINLSYKFNRQLKRLFSQSKTITDKKYHPQQLEGLPEPVQRYFRLVLKDGQPYINYFRMTHGGQFKTGLDKPWVKIKGEQYATTQKPGFIWKGTTAMFTARDMYISGKGRLLVSLLSCFPILDAKGKQYDEGELLRWLGESVLYPTNLLKSQNLKWSAIDYTTSKLAFSYKKLEIFFIVTINEIGEIVQMESKRYMDKKTLETWIIKLGNYKEINSVRVPTSFEVLWRLPKGDFSYAKFNSERIEYDIAEKF